MAHRRLDKDHLSTCCWFFCVVTVLSLAGVLSWLSLIPQNPRFRISYAHALDATNNSARPTLSRPNNTLIIDVEVTNPNQHMGIYYNAITLELYRGASVSMNSIPPFYQGYKKATTMFQMQILDGQDSTRQGNINVSIRVETDVRFRIMKWKTKMHHVTYEEQYDNAKTSSDGIITAGEYAELKNASKVEDRN